MIYITGDTHGDIDRFKQFKKLFPKYKNHVFVCGDFGFVWSGSADEQEQIKKLEKYDCIIMFVEGTHDNLDLLKQYPDEEYCGGRVKRLSKNMLWMQRGEIYEIEGQKVFAFGGGESHDADEREAGINWWPDELPSIKELEHAREKLHSVEDKVDIVITHQNPRLELGLIERPHERIDALTAFLGMAAKTIEFKHWYFGKDHIDRVVSPKMTALFEKVVQYKG